MGEAEPDFVGEGARRGFVSRYALESWAGHVRPELLAASISSFPFRHSATWRNHGFMELMNLMPGMGRERADQVVTVDLDWLECRGRSDDWFLHVHLWNPHTPYNVRTILEMHPCERRDVVPAWHTEEVRSRNWELAGPNSVEDPWGFTPDGGSDDGSPSLDHREVLCNHAAS